MPYKQHSNCTSAWTLAILNGDKDTETNFTIMCIKEWDIPWMDG